MKNRLVANVLQVMLDIIVLAASFWLAVFLRFDGLPRRPGMLMRMFFIWPYVITIQYGFLAFFGISQFAWRFIGLRDVLRILAGLFGATVILLALRYGVPLLPLDSDYLSYIQVPAGVILIDCFIAFFTISGMRVLRRIIGEKATFKLHAAKPNIPSVPTLLVGAGQAGEMMARELSKRGDLGVSAVGFLDDDPLKQGIRIHGILVRGKITDLEKTARQLGVKQVLITIASAPGAIIRGISDVCDRNDITLKIIPSLSEIVADRLSITRIRDVTIDDLLRRAPIQLDRELIDQELKGTTVCVTGAGGSIGSELCRQLCLAGVKRLVLVEQAENALYEIHKDLTKSFPEVAVEPCIADVCDHGRICQIFGQFRPDHVFHAAAHKHVPMMEWNPAEAVKNNVFGTKSVADAAAQAGVRRFVMISTDKAVNPTSVMGATKRIAEIYVQAMDKISPQTCFLAVRFGNVLGSAGSVIPLFKSQIRAGGPVTVTHPQMRRYFMTIPEACQLVLQAGSMGQGGEIFVLDMGEPVFIKDLAKDLIRLSGLTPDKDIAIKFTGIRPGEKLFEELSLANENADKTRHPKIYVGRLSAKPMDEVNAALKNLSDVAFGANPLPAAVRQTIASIVSEYTPIIPSTPQDPTSLLETMATVADDVRPDPAP